MSDSKNEKKQDDKKRNDPFFKLGEKSAETLKLGEIVHGLNNYCDKHRRGSALTIMGVFTLFVMLSFLSTSNNEERNTSNGKDSFEAAETMVTTIDKQADNLNILGDMAEERKWAQNKVDSLERLKRLTAVDSMRLLNLKKFLNPN